MVAEKGSGLPAPQGMKAHTVPGYLSPSTGSRAHPGSVVPGIMIL